MAISSAKQLQLYNDALGHCGDGALASLTERREPRYLLDGVWSGDPVKYCLEQAGWSHATRTVRMDADPGIEPDFGMRYGYEKDSDFCRTVSVSDNEYFLGKFNDFSDETGVYYANINQIFVRYVSDSDAYGRDVTKWTKSFDLYLSSYMAWRIIPRLVNSRASRADMLDQMSMAKSDAQGVDAITRPASVMSSGSWNGARHGRNSQNREGR